MADVLGRSRDMGSDRGVRKCDKRSHPGPLPRKSHNPRPDRPLDGNQVVHLRVARGPPSFETPQTKDQKTMMMNVANITRLADLLEDAYNSETGLKVAEQPPLGFNMGSWLSPAKKGVSWREDKVDSCGTVGCLAGWCAVLKGIPITAILYYGNAVDVGAEFLGLGYDTAHALFMGRDRHIDSGELHDIHPLQAVAVLRHLARTGKVDWAGPGLEHTLKARGVPVPRAAVQSDAPGG